jgi:hypothetical protein
MTAPEMTSQERSVHKSEDFTREMVIDELEDDLSDDPSDDLSDDHE